MDGDKLEYIIEFLTKGDTGKAVDELKKLQAQGEKTASTMDALKGAGEKLVAFFGAEIVLREALDKFIEAERVSAKLETALRSLGEGSEETRKTIHAMVDELKELTTFSGEAITNVAAKLLALGATKDSVKPLTEAVLDLSTLMDKDLNRATQAMGRALKGEFGAFTELGFKFDDAANTGQKLASTIEQIGKAAGGQAKAAASTLGGEMENLTKRIDDLKQKIGQVVGQAVLFGTQTIPGFLGEGSALGSTAKATEDLIRVHDKLRDSLLEELKVQERIGTVSREAADEVRRLLNQGFAGKDEAFVRPSMGVGDPGERGTRHVRDMGAEDSALKSAMARLRPDLTQSAGAASGAPPPVDVRNLEEEKAGLQSIAALRQQMFGETLNQYDQERLAASAQFEERAAGLTKAANAARLSEEQRRELEKENVEALLSDLQRIETKRQEVSDKQSLREMADALKREDYERQLSEGKVAAQLEGEDLVRYQMELNHQARMRDIRQLSFENEDQYANAIELERQLYAAEQERYNKAHSFYGLLRQDVKQLGEEGAQAFSQGLAGAIVDSFEQGDKAFQKFAANFLRLIAQMILQAIILRIVQGAAGSISFGSGSGTAGGATSGILAADGVADIPAKTYFPRFNTIAGEAGREVMTVLSRPYQANIGGVMAQIGNAGPRKLAIVDAGALARARKMADGGVLPDGQYGGGAQGGQGDKGVLEVSLSPGLEARIVQQASNAAVVEVTRQMQRDTAMNQAMRRFSRV